MNRTNICKNIVQSIKDYITDQVKLEPHRVEKHFVRRRKLSLLQVIIYLFFSSKASMFQNLSQIREELGTLSFPDVSKQALSKARQFHPSSVLILHILSTVLDLESHKSNVPYSSVDRIAVYKGRRKKLIHCVHSFPTVSIAVFFANSVLRLINIIPHIINYFLTV